MIKRLASLFVFSMLAVSAFGQGSWFQGAATTTNGASSLPAVLVVPNSSVTVCTAPATGGTNTTPCTNKVPLCTDATLGTCNTTTQNPVFADGAGNFGFWVSPGTYDVDVCSPAPTSCFIYAHQTLAAPGGGAGVFTTLSASSVSVSGLLTAGSFGNVNAGTNTITGGAAVIKNTPFIDPVAWGADPTGVADSTTAWTNALTQAASSGVEIRCQAGTYKIISTLTFGTNYGIVADGKSCILKAGAVMTNMATLGGTAPPPYNKGYMRGIQFNGNSLAAHAMFLGCSGVSCSTQFVNGYKFDAVLVYNMTGDGIQSGNNVWALGWYNFAFMNNGGNGYTLTGGNNSGEAVSFHNGSFGNNSGWGLALGNPGAGGQSVFLDGVSFDQNNLGQLQNCTSVSNGCVVSGTMHFEYNSLLTTTRQIQNFGQFTCTGCMFTGGTGNSTYQIDNEGSMVLKGGFWGNSGSGTTFNSAQTGSTVVQEVANMSTEAPIDVFCDVVDDCNFKHPINFNSSATTAVNVPNGGITAAGIIKSSSGLQPAGSGPSITGDGSSIVLATQAKILGSISGSMTISTIATEGSQQGQFPAQSGGIPIIKTGSATASTGFTQTAHEATCSTTSTQFNTCNGATLSWPVAFPDTNYDVTCTLDTPNVAGAVSHFGGKLAASITPTVINFTSGTALTTGTIECTGVER